mgnify:CR=1 FL=1
MFQILGDTYIENYYSPSDYGMQNDFNENYNDVDSVDQYSLNGYMGDLQNLF